MAKRLSPLLEAPELTGQDYTRALSDATDAWLRQLAVDNDLDFDGMALVAIGGYGRQELWPFSDIDLVLLHQPKANYSAVADSLWYPIWDRGLKLGHSVLNIKRISTVLSGDLERATSFLAGRLLLGDPDLMERFETKTRQVWRKKRHELLDKLSKAVELRHHKQADAAFHLEPNLKEGRGGLRDIHSLSWAEHVSPGFSGGSFKQLEEDTKILVQARVELHRSQGRPGDVLHLEDQDEVAERLNFPNAAQLMLRIAKAARRIGWHSDEAWSRYDRRSSLPTTGPSRPAPYGLRIEDDEIMLHPATKDDPLVLLRVASFAAKSGIRINRGVLQTLADNPVTIPEPWPTEARQLFSEMLMAGRNVIAVVEDFDQFDLMVRLIPEWETVACHPQRNIMHTFTVDRHLCEAAANASMLMNRVSRPDLLVVGALLHDIGKGTPGDHTDVGVVMINKIGTRMGFTQEDVDILVSLCRHHLLLSDVATRRDLSDSGTIATVASAVGTVRFLHLLAALTEADSIATGPAVWSSWKADLLAELVARTEYVLQGGAPEKATKESFPTPEALRLMSLKKVSLRGNDRTFLAVAPVGSYLFGLVAGVMALNGRQVVSASSYTDGTMVACMFVVNKPTVSGVNWSQIVSDTQLALDRRLALSVRVARRARERARYVRPRAAEAPNRSVQVDNEISDTATVVEIHTPDSPGLLYSIVQTFIELGIRILSAKVQTFGDQAVDSFYVCNLDGSKIVETDRLGELNLLVEEVLDGSVW